MLTNERSVVLVLAGMCGLGVERVQIITKVVVVMWFMQLMAGAKSVQLWVHGIPPSEAIFF